MAKRKAIAEVPVKISDRLHSLADFIKGKPKECFDLYEWIDEHSKCGTVACVAGWAEILWGSSGPGVSHGLAWHLGISFEESKRLCYAEYYTNPTRRTALCRLRGLARKYRRAGK